VLQPVTAVYKVRAATGFGVISSCQTNRPRLRSVIRVSDRADYRSETVNDKLENVGTLDPTVHSVATTTHGRVLVRRAAQPRGIIAGFHGYLENAAIQLARLESIPGAGRWTLVSPQALNRVYRGHSQEVVAGWMTKQDREIVIADNIAYAVSAVRAGRDATPTRAVYAGFSQGGQMAFRAAVRGDETALGIICVGADVPPELLADSTAHFPPSLLVRGKGDEWYSQAKHDADVAALQARGAVVDAVVHDGGHEWTGEVSAAAARWLERLL
jgi:predicted esterase